MDYIAHINRDRFVELASESAFYVNMAGRFVDAKEHELDHWRRLEEGVLIYCESGLGYARSQDKGREHVLEVKAGDLLWVPPHVAHRYGNVKGEQWSISWVHLGGAWLEKRMISFMDKVYTFSGRALSLEVKPQLWYRLLEEGTPPAISLLNSRLRLLLSELQYRHEQIGRSTVLETLQEVLSQSMSDSWSLEDMASQCSWSKYHLVRQFKAQLGCTPIEYLNNIRVQRACRLLRFEGLSVAEVARKVGVSDPYYFSRLFKKSLGCSPREYRQRRDM